MEEFRLYLFCASNIKPKCRRMKNSGLPLLLWVTENHTVVNVQIKQYLIRRFREEQSVIQETEVSLWSSMDVHTYFKGQELMILVTKMVKTSTFSSNSLSGVHCNCPRWEALNLAFRYTRRLKVLLMESKLLNNTSREPTKKLWKNTLSIIVTVLTL